MLTSNAQSRGWISIQDALNTLQNWRFISARYAVGYLETLLLKQELRLQFTHFFPDQAREVYLNRKKHPWPEKRFFELIERNLFPLATDALIDALEAEGEEMPWFIPIYSVNRWLDAFTYGEEEQLSDVEQALIFTGTGFTASDCAKGLANLGWKTEPPTPVNWAKYMVAQDRFVEQCLQLDPKLEHAYTAISVMTGGANNFWLDNDVEMIDQIMLEWSVANLEALAEEYQEASELLRLTGEFLDTIQESPDVTLQVVKVWIDSVTPRPIEEARPTSVAKP